MDIKFPKHECAMYLEHNDHKNQYQTAEDWLLDIGEFYLFENDDLKRTAIETDEIWTIQYYPNTPIGFISLAAPTFKDLMRFCNEASE